MSRETATNTALGAVILIAASSIFLIIVAGAWLALSSLSYVWNLFLPGVLIPTSGALFVILVAISLLNGITRLRSRRWKDAFLCFAIFPVIVSIGLADAHSPLARGPIVLPIMIVLALMPNERLPTSRLEFFLGAFIVAGVVALNAGILGWGTVARALSFSIPAAALVSVVVSVRRSQAVDENEPAASPNPA
jgi:hypothetical protein